MGPYQVFAELPDTETLVCAARRGRLDDEDRQAGLLDGLEATTHWRAGPMDADTTP